MGETTEWVALSDSKYCKAWHLASDKNRSVCGTKFQPEATDRHLTSKDRSLVDCK